MEELESVEVVASESEIVVSDSESVVDNSSKTSAPISLSEVEVSALKHKLINTIVELFHDPSPLGSIYANPTLQNSYDTFFYFLNLFIKRHRKSSAPRKNEDEIKLDILKEMARKHANIFEEKMFSLALAILKDVTSIYENRVAGVQIDAERKDRESFKVILENVSRIMDESKETLINLQLSEIAAAQAGEFDRVFFGWKEKVVVWVDGQLRQVPGVQKVEELQEFPRIIRMATDEGYAHFQEKVLAQDNQCGFQAASVKREVLYEVLLEAIKSEENRKFLAPEILNYLYEMTIGARRSPGVREVFSKGETVSDVLDLLDIYAELQKAVDLFGSTNDFKNISPSIVTWHSSRGIDLENSADILDQLKSAQKKCEEQLLEMCASEKLCNKYIKEYKRNEKSWLGRRSMKLYAEQKGLPLFAYDMLIAPAGSKNADKKEVRFNPEFSVEIPVHHAQQAVHVVFVNGNHYNILVPLTQEYGDIYREDLKRQFEVFVQAELVQIWNNIKTIAGLTVRTLSQKLGDLNNQLEDKRETVRKKREPVQEQEEVLRSELDAFRSPISSSRRQKYNEAPEQMKQFVVQRFKLPAKAAERDQCPEFKLLLSFELDINEILDEKGKNLLLIGVEIRADINVIKKLLEMQCSPFQKSDWTLNLDQRSALEEAADFGGNSLGGEQDAYKKAVHKLILEDIVKKRKIFYPQRVDLIEGLLLKESGEKLCTSVEELSIKYAEEMIKKLSQERGLLKRLILFLFGANLLSERAKNLSSTIQDLVEVSLYFDVLTFRHRLSSLVGNAKTSAIRGIGGSDFLSGMESILEETDPLFEEVDLVLQQRAYYQRVRESHEEHVKNSVAAGATDSDRRLLAENEQLKERLVAKEKESAAREMRFQVQLDQQKEESRREISGLRLQLDEQKTIAAAHQKEADDVRTKLSAQESLTAKHEERLARQQEQIDLLMAKFGQGNQGQGDRPPDPKANNGGYKLEMF